MFLHKIMMLILISGIALANEVNIKIWDFEETKAGEIPSLWQIAATHPKKTLATWEVKEVNDAPSGKKVLVLSRINHLYGGTFNLCYTKSMEFTNGEISLKFKANSGKIDQGGGIMWRVQDSDNYYVARFNPLEDNFRFYVVLDGMRMELASANVRLSKGWHRMKIIQKEDHFEGYLDGKKLLEHTDKQLAKSGGVGVWTKADAATSFDNFSVKVQR